MATSVQSRWAIRLATLSVWVLAAGSCVYWGLRIAPAAAPTVIAGPVRAPAAADPAAVARLLGASPVAAASPGAAPTVSVASRFSLLGVVASRSRHGAALIAVDGKPARPYRVGSPIDDGLVLKSVQGRSAVIAASANGPALVTLELPALKQ